jgi:hypothetical protein
MNAVCLLEIETNINIEPDVVFRITDLKILMAGTDTYTKIIGQPGLV